MTEKTPKLTPTDIAIIRAALHYYGHIEQYGETLWNLHAAQGPPVQSNYFLKLKAIGEKLDKINLCKPDFGEFGSLELLDDLLCVDFRRRKEKEDGLWQFSPAIDLNNLHGEKKLSRNEVLQMIESFDDYVYILSGRPSHLYSYTEIEKSRIIDYLIQDADGLYTYDELDVNQFVVKKDDDRCLVNVNLPSQRE